MLIPNYTVILSGGFSAKSLKKINKAPTTSCQLPSA